MNKLSLLIMVLELESNSVSNHTCVYGAYFIQISSEARQMFSFCS